ncbi:DNA/RNA nuclease SfsA [Candidatus Bathyarchaeota archaeon]|nr:DNA/RNA nuclease SfsA [Candidatus Bathyarchaeota archaeon]
MKYEKPLIEAIFKKRINRFLGIAYYMGDEIKCYIPNPGRMHELLIPETIVYLQKVQKSKRKTEFELILVKFNDTLISIDSRIPNKIIQESIENGLLNEFNGFKIHRTEPTYDDSRFDFLLHKNYEHLLLEAKSCTLVMDGVALFPDAPTERGRRHLKTLIKAKKVGRSAIIFIIQRDDAHIFSINKKMDSELAVAFQEAHLIGVEAYAYDTKVTLDSIILNKRIPIQY